MADQQIRQGNGRADQGDGMRLKNAVDGSPCWRTAHQQSARRSQMRSSDEVEQTRRQTEEHAPPSSRFPIGRTDTYLSAP